LIKRNEVNIYDIPIALITQQYLDTIQLMQELNLDVAGEFLVMAATLIHIKSKMLLPRPETAAGVEGEPEDPRDALVRRVLEHQKFKTAAGVLHEREQVRGARGARPEARVSSLLINVPDGVSGRRPARQTTAKGVAAARADFGGGPD